MSERARTVVVTGLPRSGTSLMMQVLVAGGVPALTDANRPADESNPRGYFELEAVKRLPKEPGALGESGGRCVKVIHSLVGFLPVGMEMDVVVMRRDLEEVVRSQAAMLGRLGKAGVALEAGKLKEIFAKQLEEAVGGLRKRAGARVIEVEYAELVGRPEEVCGRVAGFLGREMNMGAMVGAVDPKLYRERSGNK